MELSKWVLWARGEAKLTQDDLGEIVGCTKANVSGWENGRHQPSFDQVVAIARVARVPLPHEVDNEGMAQQLSGPAKEIGRAFDAYPDGPKKIEVLLEVLGILQGRRPDAEEVASMAPRFARVRAAPPDAAPNPSSLLVGDRLFVDAVKHVARQVFEAKESLRAKAKGKRAAAVPSASIPDAPKPRPKRKART